MANDVMMVLLEATIASTLAILLVAALRVPLRRHLGAAAAHALWSCVPLACVAILLPARQAETQWALPLVAVVQPMPVPRKPPSCDVCPDTASSLCDCVIPDQLDGFVLGLR